MPPGVCLRLARRLGARAVSLRPGPADGERCALAVVALRPVRTGIWMPCSSRGVTRKASTLSAQLSAQLVATVLSSTFVVKTQPPIRQSDGRNIAQSATTERAGRRAGYGKEP